MLLSWIALILLLTGAVNWGWVALFKVDLVEALSGNRNSTGGRLLYSLIGIAGIYTLVRLFLR